MAKPDPLVLFVRHGVAEDDHPAGDGARALTTGGRKRFRRLARSLRGEVHLAGIATSPLVRAVQTAEILAEALKVRTVVVRAALSEGSAEDVAELARSLGTGWALVGHNPTFSQAHALLLGGGVEDLEKGELSALDPAKAPWKLLWRHAPQGA